MKLRDYQTEAVESVLSHLAEHYSTLLVLPTGAGKTVVFVEVAKRWHHGRVLILAHREELVRQAAEKVYDAIGEWPGIEMGGQNSDNGAFEAADIVVGSVQSVCRPNRLARLRPEEFGLLVIDEAHHCTPQNASYQAILQHFRNNPLCKLLGPTATPDRSDKLALGQVFETCAYEMTILQGIDHGWLVPIEQRFVTVNGLDFSKVRTTAGELNPKDLENLLSSDGGRMLHEIAAATVDAAKDEPTLVFANSVHSAEMLARIISRYPGKDAHCLHGKTDKQERKYRLDQFSEGRFQFLVGCDLFLEGFDSPRISVVANAKPTKSRSRYCQTVGRGTRLDKSIAHEVSNVGQAERLKMIAASPKPRCLVLDFVGNAGQHKLISTADILGGKTAPPAAIAEAIEEAKKTGETVDMRAAIDRAQKKIEKQQREERERKAKAKREAEEKERKRLEWFRAQANYETELIDPFDVASPVAPRTRSQYHRKTPTDGMAEFLRKQGIETEGLSFNDASEIIGQLKANWNNQPCSDKQSAALAKLGENPSTTRERAGLLLELSSLRCKRRRNFLLTKDRWRIGFHDGEFRPIVIDPIMGKITINKPFRTEADCRAYIGRNIEGEK